MSAALVFVGESVPAIYDGLPRVRDASHLLNEVPATASSLVVVAPAARIDDELTRVIAMLADRLEFGAGIVPIVDELFTTRRWLEPAQAVDVRAPSAIVSVHEQTPIANLPPSTLTLISDIHRALAKSVPLHAFCGVLNGRQTYLHLDAKRLLHPTLGDRPGVVAARQPRVSHWFLQSCHSPFVWDDFGNYLTFPLALALNESSTTIICSTRVQTYIPRILEHYWNASRSGLSAGQVCRRLNEVSRQLGCDDAPFVLFGNPRTMIEPCPGASSVTRDSRDAPQQPHARTRIVRRLVRNLDALREAGYLDIKAADNAPAVLREDVKKIRALFAKQVPALRAGRDAPADGIAGAWNDLFGDRLSLQAVSERVLSAWRQAIGYYYFQSDILEHDYLPVEAKLSDSRCPSCRSAMYLRQLTPGTLIEEGSRRQYSCPRCLVVRDVVEDLDPAFRVATARAESRWTVEVIYTNQSNAPQFVCGTAYWNDPNNLSMRTNKRLGIARLERARARVEVPAPIELPPGRSVTFKGQLDSDDLFYCLLECHVLVDFAWNWLSATVRERRIEAWLSSDDYAASLSAQPVESSAKS